MVLSGGANGWPDRRHARAWPAPWADQERSTLHPPSAAEEGLFGSRAAALVGLRARGGEPSAGCRRSPAGRTRRSFASAASLGGKVRDWTRQAVRAEPALGKDGRPLVDRRGRPKTRAASGSGVRKRSPRRPDPSLRSWRTCRTAIRRRRRSTSGASIVRRSRRPPRCAPTGGRSRKCSTPPDAWDTSTRKVRKSWGKVYAAAARRGIEPLFPG